MDNPNDQSFGFFLDTSKTSRISMSTTNDDFIVSLPSSVSLLADQTMPNLLDISMVSNETTCKSMNQTMLEVEEFVCCEAVVETVVRILDQVADELEKTDAVHEDDAKQAVELDATSTVIDSIPESSQSQLEPIAKSKVEELNCNEIFDDNNSDDSGLDDDHITSPSSQSRRRSSTKRQMNESIMSLGDPMSIDHAEIKKLRNQSLNASLMMLDDTIEEKVEEEQKEMTNKNLTPVPVSKDEEQCFANVQPEKFEEEDVDVENKENCDPISPVYQKVLNTLKPSALINFDSPQPQIQQVNMAVVDQCKHELFSKKNSPSPNRPVLAELKADLFGIIYPTTESTGEKTLNENSIIKQFEPTLTDITSIDNHSLVLRKSLFIANSQPESVELSSSCKVDEEILKRESISKEDSVQVETPQNDPISLSSEKLQIDSSHQHRSAISKEETINSSCISIDHLFAASASSSLIVQNNELNKSEVAISKTTASVFSANSSIISTDLLFNKQTTISNIDQQDKSTSSTNSSVISTNLFNINSSKLIDESSIISTGMLFNQSLLNRSNSDRNISSSPLVPNRSMSTTSTRISNASVNLSSNCLFDNTLTITEVNDSLNKHPTAMHSTMIADEDKDELLQFEILSSPKFVTVEEMDTTIGDEVEMLVQEFECEVKKRVQELSFIMEENETVVKNQSLQNVEQEQVVVIGDDDNDDEQNCSSKTITKDDNEIVTDATQVAENESKEPTFSTEDHLELIETKLMYESKIVELSDRIEQLEEKLQHKAQIEVAKLEEDMTFSMQDRVDLIETKLDYENKLVELKERVEQLETELAEARHHASVVSNSSVENKKMESSVSDFEIIEQHEATFTAEDRIKLIETKLAYENEIVNLHERIETLQNEAQLATMVNDANSIETKALYDKEVGQLRSVIDLLQQQLINKQNIKLESNSSKEMIEEKTSINSEQQDSEFILVSEVPKTVDIESQTSFIDNETSKLDITLAEKTFTEEDRISLIETKLKYETDLVTLQEMLDTLKSRLADVEFAKQEAEEQLEMAQAKYELSSRDKQRQVERLLDRIKVQEDEYSILTCNYEKLIEMKQTYEEMKKEYRILSDNQYEIQNENEKLKETILEMDEQRSSLRQAIETTQQELNNCQLKLTDVIGTNDKLFSQLSHAEQCLTTANDNIASLNATIETLQNSATTQEDTIKRLSTELSDLSEKLTESNEELKAIKFLSEDYMTENSELMDENQILKSKVDELTRQLAEFQEATNTKVVELEEKNHKYELEIEELTIKHKEDSTKLCVQLDSSNEKVVILEQRLTDVNSELASKNTIIDDLELKLKDATEQLKMFDAREQELVQVTQKQTEQTHLLATSEKKLSKLQSHFNSVQSECDKLTTLLETMKVERQKDDERLVDLNSKCSQLNEQNCELSDTVAALTNELAETKQTLEQTKTHKMEIFTGKETELSDLRQNLQQLEAKLTKITGHNEQLRAEAKETKLQFEQLDQVYQNTRKRHGVELCEANDQIASLNSMVAKLEQRNTELVEQKAEIEEQLRLSTRQLSDHRLQVEQTIQAKTAKLQAKVNQLETDLRQLTTELNEAKEAVVAAEKKYVQREVHFNTEQELCLVKLKNVEVVNANLRQSNDKINTRLMTLERERSQCELALIDLDQAKQAAKEYSPESDNDDHTLADTIRSLCKLLQKLNTQQAKYVDDIETKNKETQELHTQLTHLQSQVQHLETQLTQKQAEENEKKTTSVTTQTHPVSSSPFDDDENVAINEEKMWKKLDILAKDLHHSTGIYLTLKGASLTQSKKSLSISNKLASDIYKLVDKITNDKHYKESVKSDLVKKMLTTIQEKLNTIVAENQTFLSLYDK